MKKLITLISFIFIFIFGCLSSFAYQQETSASLATPTFSNSMGSIEWVTDFESISKEITYGNYVLNKTDNTNISGLKDNPDNHLLNLSNKNEQQNNFYISTLNTKNKQSIQNKSFILQTNPRGP